MAIDTGDSVTFEYTGRLDDGSVFDTSRRDVAEEAGLTAAQPDREYEPLTVEIGADEVIAGLETALIGMAAGETTTVTVPPEEAYGTWSEEHVHEYDAEAFSRMVGGEAFEAGQYIQLEEGGIGEIVGVEDDTVRVDFNHELADETLEFEIEVVDVE